MLCIGSNLFHWQTDQCFASGRLCFTGRADQCFAWCRLCFTYAGGSVLRWVDLFHRQSGSVFCFGRLDLFHRWFSLFCCGWSTCSQTGGSVCCFGRLSICFTSRRISCFTMVGRGNTNPRPTIPETQTCDGPSGKHKPKNTNQKPSAETQPCDGRIGGKHKPKNHPAETQTLTWVGGRLRFTT